MGAKHAPPLAYSECLYECGTAAYIISMKITPASISPQVEACLPLIRSALHDGIDFANDIQPDAPGRDPWYWSHSARFKARNVLEAAAASAQGWAMIEGVPNSGIHLRLGGLHVMRVLRSAAGSTPAPGHSRARRRAWQQGRQLQFAFDDGLDGLPPVDLILDWSTDDADELSLHLGMPLGVWDHGSHPILAWRIPLPSSDELGALAFQGSDESEIPVHLRIDEAELAAQ